MSEFEFRYRELAFGPIGCPFDGFLPRDGDLVELVAVGEFAVDGDELGGLVAEHSEPFAEVVGGAVVFGGGELCALVLLVAEVTGVGDLVAESARSRNASSPVCSRRASRWSMRRSVDSSACSAR